MSISADTVWEVRQAGSDSQGGLFRAAQPSAGIDYSQSDTPILSLTDVVTNGTTTVTSATGGFTANMIGNGINIAGTCYMIATYVNTNEVTIDRVVGAASGQTGKVGGALGSPGYCAGQAVTANQVWIKAGAYSITSGSANVAGGRVNSPGGTAAFPFKWEGYQTTRGDKGTKPVITDSGIGAVGSLFAQSASYCIFDNLTVVDASGNQAIRLQQASTQAIRCKAQSTGGIGFYVTGNYCSLLLCEGTGDSPFYLNAVCLVFGCYSHGSTGDGFFVTGANFVSLSRCIAQGATDSGFNSGAGLQVAYEHCTAYDNGDDGFLLSSSGGAAGIHAVNCLSVGNGGWGFNSAAASGFVTLLNCAHRDNTSGGIHANLTRTEGTIALSGDPFTAAGTDFGLNATAGAGADLRGEGVPGAFPGLASTVGYPDVGAVQHQDAGGGSPVTRAYGFVG